MDSYFKWSGSPVLFDLGFISIRWYGLMFALAFFLGFKIMNYIYKKESKDLSEVDSLFSYMFFGTLIGARLGHCFFYHPKYYLSNPFEIIKVWNGGLASHGGAIGIIIAILIFSKKYKESFFWVISRLGICVALAGFFIRLGNFFNSEIVGNPSNSFSAIIFTKLDQIPRHPTMLYESFFYLILFLVLLFVYKRKIIKTDKSLFGLFLFSLFLFRFLIEFTKQRQTDLTIGWDLSMGQVLSMPFIVLGFFLLVINRKKV